MKKLRNFASILMLAAAVVFAAGCTKPDEPNNEGNDNNGGGGVYGYEPYHVIVNVYPHTYHYEWYVLGDDVKNGLLGQYANADWSVYNAISNGGNQPGLWRTLTGDEWEYVINGREGSRWCPATVNGIKGAIIPRRLGQHSLHIGTNQ